MLWVLIAALIIWTAASNYSDDQTRKAGVLPTFFDQTFSANKRETSANVQQILRNCKFKAKGAETERQGMAWRDKIKHNLEITVPAFFTCPISLELMKDPVSTCTGVTYDRSSIEKWIDEGHTTCPATLQQLETMELIPNHTLRRLIQAWCSANASLGVERIPTPKTPANPSNVRSLFEEVGSSSSQDRIVALKRLKSLAKDSVRNAICIADEGGTQVLCGVLSEGSLEEIELAVCVLAVLPLDDPAKKRIGGVSELSALAALVKDGGGSLEARICSAEVVERISSEPRVLSQISSIGGLARGLVEMLHEMATPKAMKSALKALLAVCSISKIRMEAVSAGAVESLIDILIEKEKGADELCLSLLECLCRCAEGRAAVTGHALGIPVVVKKMTRSSPVATEFAVGVLWSVCSRSNDATMAARYAAESGLCSKLFWVLQTECSPKAKIKASDLIRFVHSACSDCPCCYTTSLLENAAVHQDDD